MDQERHRSKAYPQRRTRPALKAMREHARSGAIVREQRIAAQEAERSGTLVIEAKGVHLGMAAQP